MSVANTWGRAVAGWCAGALRPAQAALRAPAVCLTVLACLTLAACSGGAGSAATSGSPANPQSTPPSASTLRVLAGSELKELEPDILQTARAAGVNLSLSYAGTLEMVDRVNAGESWDAILPPNGAYPSLALAHKPLAKEKLFYSRVA